MTLRSMVVVLVVGTALAGCGGAREVGSATSTAPANEAAPSPTLSGARLTFPGAATSTAPGPATATPAAAADIAARIRAAATAVEAVRAAAARAADTTSEGSPGR